MHFAFRRLRCTFFSHNSTSQYSRLQFNSRNTTARLTSSLNNSDFSRRLERHQRPPQPPKCQLGRLKPIALFCWAPFESQTSNLPLRSGRPSRETSVASSLQTQSGMCFLHYLDELELIIESQTTMEQDQERRSCGPVSCHTEWVGRQDCRLTHGVVQTHITCCAYDAPLLPHPFDQ